MTDMIDKANICPECGQAAHGGIPCDTMNLIFNMNDQQFAELNKWIGRMFPGTQLRRVETKVK